MRREPLRLCGRLAYCSSLRAARIPGPLCPYCDRIEHLLVIWGKR